MPRAFCTCRRCPASGQDEGLGARQPLEQVAGGAAGGRRRSRRPARQTGCPICSASARPNAHSRERGQLLAEEPVRAVHRLGERFRQCPVERGAVVLTAGPSQEDVDGLLLPAGLVHLHRLADLRRARNRQERRLQQGQRAHRLGSVPGEPQGDHRARRMADHVGALDPERRISRRQWSRLPCEVDRAARPAAAGVAGAVIEQEAVSGEGRLARELTVPVHADTVVDQDHRLAGPVDSYSRSAPSTDARSRRTASLGGRNRAAASAPICFPMARPTLVELR